MTPSFIISLGDAGNGAVSVGVDRGSGAATFTRAGATATTTLPNGLVSAAIAANVARSNYSAAGAYLGYLVEQASTNICLRSADLSNASWVKSGSTIGGSTAMPDGSTGTVNKIQEDNTNGIHTAIQTFTKAASSLAYTLNIYLKPAERTWAFIALDDTVNNCVIFFNLGTGVLGSTIVTGVGFTITATSITPAANGFYRCTLSCTSSASTTLRIIFGPSTGDTVTSYQGVTGNGIYAWGMQLEQLAFGTSYIPTVAAAVTRNADVLTFPLTGNFDNTKGTCYAEITPAELSALNVRIITDTGSNKGVIIRATGQPRFFDGTNNLNSGLGNLAVGTLSKVASRWSGTAGNLVMAGTLGSSTAFTGNMGFVSNISLGVDNTAADTFNGNIKNVMIWQSPQNNGVLDGITARQ